VSNTLQIIERVRAVTARGTDYAVAKALGMPQSNLKKIIRGDRRLGPNAIFRAAELLKVDAKDLYKLVREDRTTSNTHRSGAC